MGPVEMVAAAAAAAAFKLIEEALDNMDDRKEAARRTRELLTDQKLLLRADAQAMLDERRKR